MELALFATLPLALFSFLSKGKRSDAGFGFLAALAPVVISAVKGIIDKKKKQSAEKKKTEYMRTQAQQEEEANRRQYEAQQNSPDAQMRRLGFNTRLSALLGGFGGREQTPGFIQSAFDASRMPQQYTPGAEFVEPPKSGSAWDYADIGANALSYFDTSGYSRSKAGQGAMGLAPMAQTTQSPGLALPSSFKNKNYFNLGDTPAADDFLNQRR